MVYSRITKSSGGRISDPEDSWSLALYPWEQTRGFVQRLCEHLAKTKTRKCRMASRLWDAWADSSLCEMLWRPWEHQTRECGRELRMESGCQNAPEFVSNLTAVKVCILKKLSCRVFLKIILVAMNCTVHILLHPLNIKLEDNVCKCA